MKFAWLDKFSALVHSPAGDFRLASPVFLLGLLAVPVIYILVRSRETQRVPTLRFSTVALVKKAAAAQRHAWAKFLPALRMLALSLLVVAMSRPQFGRVERQTYSEGIDIMLVLDVSLSMRTGDFYPNRLEAAKEVLKEFVSHRVGDRLGLVIFGTDAVTLVPMTLDYGVVRSFIDRVRFQIVEGDRTAIGMGLGTALKKLHSSLAKSKVIILLTDGENNAGKINPMDAAEAAKTDGVRVYTIGVGSDARQYNPFGQQDAGIDEKLLKQIAEMTGAIYFRATDNERLADIYEQIDKLEKTKVESTQFDNFNDLAAYFALPALLLVVGEMLLRSTRYLRVP